MSKNTKQICILYYIVYLTLISVISSLNYSEFKLLSPSCIPRDTCNRSIRAYITRLLDWKFRNCFCDEFCQDYGDCCLDSNFYQEHEQIERFRHFECVNVELHGDIYMKSMCMKDWENAEMSTLCQNNGLTDRYNPVTSKYTAITYINYFCAICNNDATDLMVWKTSLECPNLKNILEQNSNINKNPKIEVLIDNDKLGILLQKEGLQVFHECFSVPSFPQSGNSLFRKCFPTISKCVDQWSDAEIEKLCHSYTAVIHSHNEAFRNIHCAMCNNIDIDSLHCTPRSIPHVKYAAGTNAKAFAILFDFFDFSGSNMVGTHCKENEIWDSIFQKCRTVICKNKKYEYKHGKCVRTKKESVTEDELDLPQSVTTEIPFIHNTEHMTPQENEFIKTKQESEYFTTPLNDHNSLTTIKEGIDTLPNKEIILNVTEDELDLPQSVTTEIPFIHYTEHMTAQENEFIKTKQESEYFTTPLNDHNSLTTIKEGIDSLPNKEIILNVTEDELDLPQSVTTAIPFIQSSSCNSNCITDIIDNTYNRLPSSKEKNTKNSLIQNTRNTSLLKPKLIDYSISNNIEQINTQANELMETQKLDCSQILLTADELTKKKNNSIFVSKLDKLYSLGEYTKEGENILVCVDDFISFKFSYFMCIITVIGLVMSCICLILHLFSFILVPHQRNLAGKNLASLSSTLLASYSVFIVSMFSNAQETLCYIIALVLYYSFLSSFFWMNIISFDIWWTLYKTQYLLIVEGNQSLRFILYSIYSFGLPGIALVIAFSLDKLHPSGFPKEFLPYFGKLWCWFGQRKSLLIFFALPIIVLMILNVGYLCWSIYIIKKTNQLTVNVRSCSLYINQFRLYTSLSVVMGITWITGIIAGCIQSESAWYIFIILNTLQGVFIFAVFTCKRRVWQAFIGLIFR